MVYNLHLFLLQSKCAARTNKPHTCIFLRINGIYERIQGVSDPDEFYASHDLNITSNILFDFRPNYVHGGEA